MFSKTVRAVCGLMCKMFGARRESFCDQSYMGDDKPCKKFTPDRKPARGAEPVCARHWPVEIGIPVLDRTFWQEQWPRRLETRTS